MYDPQIYPRKLWVAVGPEELDEQFKFYLTDKIWGNRKHRRRV